MKGKQNFFVVVRVITRKELCKQQSHHFFGRIYVILQTYVSTPNIEQSNIALGGDRNSLFSKCIAIKAGWIGLAYRTEIGLDFRCRRVGMLE